jgi:hypothetical protein
LSAQEARAAAPRRVREFHEPFFGRGAGCAGEEDWDFAGEEELPCPQHAIEQIDESLIHNLRERLPHGLAQDRVVDPANLHPILRVPGYTNKVKYVSSRELWRLIWRSRSLK